MTKTKRLLLCFLLSTGLFFPGRSNAGLSVDLKIYLQGAYSSSLVRHKNVTSTWAGVLNSYAVSQPYNTAPWNYSGTESVASNFFTSTSSATDIVDWVLLEIRDTINPSVVLARMAALVREDGKVVSHTDGVSDPVFDWPQRAVFLAVWHRNHLPVRTATRVDPVGGVVSWDFTSAQSNAYQNPSVTTNAAMVQLATGVFGMWGGNANTNTSVRSSGPTSALNDFLYLVNITLGGNVAVIIGPPASAAVYSNSDLTMDGTVRASHPNSFINDLLFLWNIVLSGNVAVIINQHL